MSTNIHRIPLKMISFGYIFTSMKENRPPAYPLRIPEELREKLQASANEGRRPLSSEILMRLEDSFKTTEQLNSEDAAQTDEIISMIRELMEISKSEGYKNGLSEKDKTAKD
jgi:flagellar biosynthesis/type III secretory pathway protein FliH